MTEKMCRDTHTDMDYIETYSRNRVAWLYAVARCKQLGPNAVRVGLLFATFLQPLEREVVSPSYEWMMANAHIKSRSTLHAALVELEKAGFLFITRYHRYRSQYSMPFNGDELWNAPLSTENGL